MYTEWLLEESSGKVWLKIGASGVGGGGSCERGYEPSGSLNCGEFLTSNETNNV